MFKLSGHFWDQLCRPASAYCSSIDWLIDWHVVSCWRRWMVIVYRVFYKEVWVKIVAHETESLHLPSVLWRCWLGDMHMAQLMPLPLTVTCFSKIQIGFTFLVPAHPGSPGERPINRVCVCVCVSEDCCAWDWEFALVLFCLSAGFINCRLLIISCCVLSAGCGGKALCRTLNKRGQHRDSIFHFTIICPWNICLVLSVTSCVVKKVYLSLEDDFLSANCLCF